MGGRTKFDQLADSIEMLTNHIITKKECFKQIAELFCDVNSESNAKCFDELNAYQIYLCMLDSPSTNGVIAINDTIRSMDNNSFMRNFTRLS